MASDTATGHTTFSEPPDSPDSGEMEGLNTGNLPPPSPLSPSTPNRQSLAGDGAAALTSDDGGSGNPQPASYL